MSAKPAFELRLLGMRYEEAMKALERQLDLCAIHNLNSFSIIHGKGNGILQQGVHTYLKNYGGIKEFHFARPEDGGTGKTYVNL
jgi:DNA mismatch repair protein MutS2